MALSLTEYLHSKRLINKNIINMIKYLSTLVGPDGKKKTEEEILFEKGFVEEEEIFKYYIQERGEKYKGILHKDLLPFLYLDRKIFEDINLKTYINTTVQEEQIKYKDLSAVLVTLNIEKISKATKEQKRKISQIVKEMGLKKEEGYYFILTNRPYKTRLHKKLSIRVKDKTGRDELPVFMLNTKNYLHFLVDFPKTEEEFRKVTSILNTHDNPDEVIKKGYFKRWFDLLLKYSLEAGASDIHIEPDDFSTVIRIRKDGILQIIAAIRKEYDVFSLLKTKTRQNDEKGAKPLDGELDFDHPILNKTNVRWAEIINVYGGKSIVARLLPSGINAMKLDELGFPKRELRILKKHLLRQPNGIILITGPTGSGKTNTLSAILRYISRLENKTISVEDPVEIKIPLIQQIQVNEKGGLTVHAAIKSFLRQDPDILFVGEIRDLEMAKKAVEGAMTGHLMFATLHTNDSVSAIMRLKDIGISPDYIANTLRGVLAQRLVRKLCPHCKEKLTREELESDELFNEFGLNYEDGEYFRHKEGGCPKCDFTGYKGRRPVVELFVVDKMVQQMILDNASSNYIINEIKRNNFKTLLANGLELVQSGVTDLDEIVRVLGKNNDETTFDYDSFISE